MKLLIGLGILACLTAAPVTAQTDALIGAWALEREFEGDPETNVLQLASDGTFRWEASLITDLDEFFELDFSEFDADDSEDPEAAFFALLLLAALELGTGEITTTFEGEWETDGNALILTGHITDTAIDDQPLVEFFVAAFSAAIETLAEFAEEFAEEEDAPAETPADTEIEAALAELGMEIAALFAELMEEEIVDTYLFAAGTEAMTLVDEDDEESDWTRVPLASAVTAQSWGQLKKLRQ